MSVQLLIVILATFIIADIALVIFIFWQKRQKTKKFDQIFYLKEWRAILEIKKQSLESAIIAADKLFDKAMSDLEYEGSFVEKFKNGQYAVRSAQAIWDAHKIRNRIAHESGYRPDAHEASLALSAYRAGLKDFGVKL